MKEARYRNKCIVYNSIHKEFRNIKVNGERGQDSVLPLAWALWLGGGTKHWETSNILFLYLVMITWGMFTL